MKSTFFALAATVFLFSCSNEPAKQEETTKTENETSATAPLATTDVDPICKMPREAGWTEHVVNGTDTVWFCSSTCKETYEERNKK